jgi:uncharacterized protein (DUF305 family)
MNLRIRLITQAASVAALGLALAACSASADTDEPTDAATAGLTAGANTSQGASSHNDADTTFAQMMIVHHEGAVEMAALAQSRAETAQVRELAERIRAAQGPEIETMETWLESWDEDLSAMADHDMMGHGGMAMDGMDQGEAMAALDATDGQDFDAMFLELMIQHHRGAVAMSQEQIENGENLPAKDLAEKIIDDQEAEIAEMEQLLEASAL